MTYEGFKKGPISSPDRKSTGTASKLYPHFSGERLVGEQLCVHCPERENKHFNNRVREKVERQREDREKPDGEIVDAV